MKHLSAGQPPVASVLDTRLPFTGQGIASPIATRLPVTALSPVSYFPCDGDQLAKLVTVAHNPKYGPPHAERFDAELSEGLHAACEVASALCAAKANMRCSSASGSSGGCSEQQSHSCSTTFKVHSIRDLNRLLLDALTFMEKEYAGLPSEASLPSTESLIGAWEALRVGEYWLTYARSYNRISSRSSTFDPREWVAVDITARVQCSGKCL
jgi:hypothetical protein